jgi:hypothetical protein
MISSLLPENHRQGREHALVFSVEASLNFLSRPYVKPKVEKAADIEKRQLSWQRGKRIATTAFHITE